MTSLLFEMWRVYPRDGLICCASVEQEFLSHPFNLKGKHLLCRVYGFYWHWRLVGDDVAERLFAGFD